MHYLAHSSRLLLLVIREYVRSSQSGCLLSSITWFLGPTWVSSQTAYMAGSIQLA